MTVEQYHKLVVEAYSHNGGVELAKALIQQQPGPPPQDTSIPWCICRKCRNMDQPIKRKCCKQLPCSTDTAAFDTVVLD